MAQEINLLVVSRQLMKFNSMFIGMGLSLLLGCESGTDGPTLVAVERNDLGITQVEVEHTVQNQDPLLVIRGLDDRGEEIATATLRTGMVLYSSQPESLPAGWSHGTELVISVGTQTFPVVTPDTRRHTFGPVLTPTLAAFVGLDVVTKAIDQEAGLAFAQAAHGEEVPFIVGAPQDCTASHFGNNQGNPEQCCEDSLGQIQVHRIKGGNNNTKLAIREYGDACTYDGTTTGCVDSACSFGPCGAHIVSGGQGTGGAVVYYPFVYLPGAFRCGWDDNGTASGGSYDPQAFTSQGTYGGVTGTCPYGSCTSTGAPGNPLTITVVGAPGAVSDAGGQLYVQSGYSSTAGVASGYLTATSLGGSGVYVQSWSGAGCSGTGDSCYIDMGSGTAGATRNVTVTFGCNGDCPWQ